MSTTNQQPSALALAPCSTFFFMDTNQTQLTPEVIAALNEELAYQNRMAGTPRASTRDNGVCGQVLTLVALTNETAQTWQKTPGDEATLNMLRKCAAVAIRALVNYGCPRRQ